MASDFDEMLSKVTATLDRMLRSKRGKTILTKNEIQTWLHEQPSFDRPIAERLSDDSYHKDSSDEDLTEPQQASIC